MVRMLCVGATLLLSLSAAARVSFQPLPPEKPGDPATGLTAMVVSYDGNTNGALTIDVKNPTGAALDFTATGLYFVPIGDPDKSPQRLGAVGSYEVQRQDKWSRQEKISIPAGATVRTRLDVYCIDSHRPSPSSSTPFSIAKDRVPVNISRAIHEDATKASEGMGGMAAPAAKSAVQGTVWKVRDRSWVKLDGEGKQEATK
jgi:hypothetical protein